MNRNTELHFSQIPTVDISRSKFDRSFTHITTGNASELIPVFVDPDIIPGDTVTMRQSEIIRMMTPIAPVMDNAFMDFYWFFVPNRLVYTNWKQLMGENETTPWTQEIERLVPQIKMDNTIKNSNNLIRTVLKGSVLDHMGIPTQNSWTYAASAADKKEISISSLPTKAYALIWNEFFRDENLQNPVYIAKGDGDHVIINANSSFYINDPDATQVSDAQYGGLPCLKVCKPHDYFTSCLPGAQKGPAIRMPFAENEVPVNAKVWNDSYQDPSWSTALGSGNKTGVATWIAADSGRANGMGLIEATETGDYTQFMPDDPYIHEQWTTSDNQNNYHQLYVDMSNAVGATINQLRQAFAIQKFYERDARGGWANA